MNVFIWRGCYFLPVKFSVFVYDIFWNLSMQSTGNALNLQHVAAYAFSAKTGNPKNDDFSDKIGLCRVLHKAINNMFDTKLFGTSWGSWWCHYLF